MARSNSIKKNRKLIALFLSAFLLFTIGIAQTFAWQSGRQSAFNPAFDSATETFQITLLKQEIDVHGVRTELPVADA